MFFPHKRKENTPMYVGTNAVIVISYIYYRAIFMLLRIRGWKAGYIVYINKQHIIKRVLLTLM